MDEYTTFFITAKDGRRVEMAVVLPVILALSLLVPQSLLTVQADTSAITVRDSKVNENPTYSKILRIRIREDWYSAWSKAKICRVK